MAEPRDDGTRGSALYRIPLRLSRTPTAWAEYFVAAWATPPRWMTRHRPDIASVVGDTIILDGTTIEELEQVHVATLRLALEVANQQEEDRLTRQADEAQRRERAAQAHEANVRAAAERIRFDPDPRDGLGPDDPQSSSPTCASTRSTRPAPPPWIW